MNELADHGRGRRQKRQFSELHERIEEVTSDLGLAGSMILIEKKVPDLLGMLVRTDDYEGRKNKYLVPHRRVYDFLEA